MKKLLIMLIAGAMALSLTACGGGATSSSSESSEESTVESQEDSSEESSEEAPEESSEEESTEESSEESGEESDEESSEGGEDASEAVVGKWTATKVQAEGLTISLQEFAAATEMDMEITFDFKADGTVVGEMPDISAEGTYEVDGNNVAVTFEGETETMVLDGDELSLEMDGIKIILSK